MDRPLFFDLNNQGAQGPTMQPHQRHAMPGHQARPTPPPGPPMGQMPYPHSGGQLVQGPNFQGGNSALDTLGQSGPFGFPPPLSHGGARPFSRSSHSSRRSPPIIHNTALERRQQGTTEVHDIRTTVNTDNDARKALSSYVVCTITKATDDDEDDEYGFPTEPTWQRATHTIETGVTQKEAARKVRELQWYTKSVSDKKADLASPIKTQLQYAQEKLERQELDRRYRFELIQFDQVIKRVETSPYRTDRHYQEEWSDRRHRSRSKDRRSSKDKKKRDKIKYRKGKYVVEPHKSWKTKSKRQTESVTAYYKRVPCDNVDCLQLWQDLEDGFDSWDSPNSSPRFLTQQPFGANHPHLPNHFGDQRTHHQHQHQHQGNQMHMPQPQGPQRFNPVVQHGMNGQQGVPPPHHNGAHGQAGIPSHHQQMPHGMPGQQGVPPPHHNGPHGQAGGPAQHQQMPHGMPGQQGAPPPPYQQHQGNPQQPQYAHTQGQQRGPPGLDPRVQQGPHGMHQNGQQPQPRPGQPGAPHNGHPGGGRGQQPPGNGFPQNGPPPGHMGRGHMPNQRMQPQPVNKPGPQQKGSNGPPPPPVHLGNPAARNGSRPPQVLSMSPRSSANSLSDSEYGSGSDSGSDTPASSVNSDGLRGRSRRKDGGIRTRSLSRGHGPKVYNVPPREHSRLGTRRRSPTPPVFRPRSAMRTTPKPGLNRHATWQNEMGRSTPRHMGDDPEHFPTKQRLNSFDREMLGRAMAGNFERRAPRRAFSDDFEHMPRRGGAMSDFEHMPRRAAAMSDFDQAMPGVRRHRMNEFDNPRLSRDGLGHGFRRVSPTAARQAMGEDDVDIMSDAFDGLRLNKEFGGDGRAFRPERFERGLRSRFEGREYYYDDDGHKHTRFADGAPGRDYARPASRAFVNEGRRSLGPRRAGPPYYD